MKKNRLFVWILAILSPISMMAATANLSIDNSFSIKAGEEKELFINLTNPDVEIVALDFQLRLPQGLSIKKVDGEYVYDMVGRTTWKTHKLSENDLGGVIKFFMSSSDGKLIEGTDGSIIRMTMQADNSFVGGDIYLENIVLKGLEGPKIQQDTYTYSIPMNDTGTVSLRIFPQPELVIAKGADVEVTINLDNPLDDITMVSFDMYLPDGLMVKDYDITERTTIKNHSLDVSDMGGFLRFILSSQKNKLLNGNEGAVIKMTLFAMESFRGGIITLRDIRLQTYPEKKKITLETYTYSVSKEDTPSNPIVVSVKSISREYGDSNPLFEYSVQGGTLDGKPEISCLATEKSYVGKYDLTITKGSVKNDNVKFVGGYLTVTKAPLTISGGTYTMNQGEALPTFKAIYSGWKNGDTETVLIQEPTLKTTATSYSAPGTYDVIVGGADAQNYTITYKKGTLTIIGKPDPYDDMAAITFVAGKKERSIAIGLNAAGKVGVDWGDGKIVEQEATAAYDGWDNLLEFTGMPSGTVKIYADGVTYFQSFTKYDAGATTISGGISSIDLSNVGATLEELDIHQNNLKSVDLSKLTALTTLSIGVNDFTTINLSVNTALTKLDISSGMNDGKLSAIDLSKNTRLTNIVLSGNQLTALDLSHNTLAKTVTVVNNQLSNIIFGANTATKHTINLGGNRLTIVDLSRFADASGTYLRLRDNDLTEVKLPVKISQLWVDGNAFTLAQLYALKNMAKTFTYATTYSKAEAQAPMSINADDGRVDLASQAILGQTATMFTWKDATGSSLTQGIDYTESNGVFTFLKPFSGIRCEMTNSELTGLTVKTMPVTVTAASGSSTAKLSIRDFRIKRGYRADMIIELSNPEDEITSVQFDLRLPEGLSIKQTDGEYVIDIAGRTSWRKHTLDANATDGIVRFLLASISNAPLSGTSGAIIKVTLVADDHYNWSDVSLENILLTTTDGRQLSTEDVTYYLRTGINSVTAEEKDAEVFSLSGQRVLAPKKGINIIDRKKVVVK